MRAHAAPVATQRGTGQVTVPRRRNGFLKAGRGDRLLRISREL